LYSSCIISGIIIDFKIISINSIITNNGINVKREFSVSNSRADLILHPVRARIIVEVSGRRITAKEIAESMPEIPMTTLYRHINALTDGGILAVVEENQVRGTVERVYALDREATDLTPEELSQMTREDYDQLFTLFVTSLLGDFSRYLDNREPENIDIVADGLKFGKVQLHLTEAEFEALQIQVYGAIESVVGNEPSPDRKPRIASVTFIPTGNE
jgi:DNA-binding transcriptional ArsR family regulator